MATHCPYLCHCPFVTNLYSTVINCTRDWTKVGALTDKQAIPYDSLPPSSNTQLNKLVVLKVNGGLGTSMGKHTLW